MRRRGRRWARRPVRGSTNPTRKFHASPRSFGCPNAPSYPVLALMPVRVKQLNPVGGLHDPSLCNTVLAFNFAPPWCFLVSGCSLDTPQINDQQWVRSNNSKGSSLSHVSIFNALVVQLADASAPSVPYFCPAQSSRLARECARKFSRTRRRDAPGRSPVPEKNEELLLLNEYHYRTGFAPAISTKFVA